MFIRPLVPLDLDSIRKIHSKYYKDEFSFEDFCQGFLASCVIEDERGEIICAGGIRNIPELVLITDKDHSVRERREALYKVLEAGMFVGTKLGFNGLHAFIQDPTWEKHLIRVGFRPTVGHSLVLPL